MLINIFFKFYNCFCYLTVVLKLKIVAENGINNNENVSVVYLKFIWLYSYITATRCYKCMMKISLIMLVL